MKLLKKTLILTLVASLLFNCKSMNKTTKGGIIGATSGAVVGGVIGNRAGNTAAGAIIGATVGGAAGALIGRYMDKQAEELRRDLKNARVERVGEGIKITFNSGILFDVNSSQLRAASRENLADLARTLNKYEDTNVLIEGHTDNTGTDEYNYALSDRRASSVSAYLKNLNVSPARISTHGYGESQPIDSNNTEAGKQNNRRVEVAIFANKKLKRAAERGDIGSI